MVMEMKAIIHFQRCTCIIQVKQKKTKTKHCNKKHRAKPCLNVKPRCGGGVMTSCCVPFIPAAGLSVLSSSRSAAFSCWSCFRFSDRRRTVEFKAFCCRWEHLLSSRLLWAAAQERGALVLEWKPWINAMVEYINTSIEILLYSSPNEVIKYVFI